ncbi:hypothetical protein HOY80DRAFT_939675 [Tuber brumale]|nr:hypothetical protein HOY80DRAFT_939675 [Tuber brumale]
MLGLSPLTSLMNWFTYFTRALGRHPATREIPMINAYHIVNMADLLAHNQPTYIKRLPWVWWPFGGVDKDSVRDR